MKALSIVTFLGMIMFTWGTASLSTCRFCQEAVLQSEEHVISSGCSWWFQTKAAMYCKSVDLDPQIPSDQCVPLLVKGCNLIQLHIQQQTVPDPVKICTSLELC